jgi:hypothetical protein
MGTSTNWVGYAVNANRITAISASWTIPTVQCAGTPGSNTVMVGISVWIGFDGLSGEVIPEQLGTEAVCFNQSPFYLAWEEDPTLNSGALPAFADALLSGGDYITASIAYLGNNQFRMSIADTTTGDNRVYNIIVHNAPRLSAEWIAEIAYNTKTGKDWSLPNNLQPITFTDCSASVNNVAGSIKQNNAQPIELTDSNGNMLASPQNMNQAGTSFQIVQAGSATPEFSNSLIALLPILALLIILRKRIAHRPMTLICNRTKFLGLKRPYIGRWFRGLQVWAYIR